MLTIVSQTLAQNCESFLNHGLYNLETTTSQNDFEQHLFNEVCSESFDVRSLSEGKMKSFGGSLGYAGFSVGASSSGGSSRSEFEEARQAFCSTTSSATAQRSDVRSEVRTMFPEALLVYERCLTLQARGLSIDMQVTPNPGQAVTVTYGLSRSGGPDIRFAGVHIDPIGAFTCRGQLGLEGEVIEFGEGTSASVTNNQISMTCRRNVEGGVYSGATIAIHTNDENLVTYFGPIPSPEQVQESRARDLENRTIQVEERLSRQLLELRESLAELEQRVGALEPGLARLIAEKRFTPLDVELGELSRTHGRSSSYELPSEVPASAREVLVHAWVRSGWSGTPGASRYYEISTAEGSRTLGHFFLRFSTYRQDAVAFNSETMWLPVSEDRTVRARLAGDGANLDQYTTAFLRIIGFR